MCRVCSIDCDGTPNGLTRNACTSATATSAMSTSVNMGRRRRRRVVAPSVAGAAVTQVTLVRPHRGVDLVGRAARCKPWSMVSLVLGMLACVALALVVMALVAVPARRAGREVLSERGEEVLGSIRDRQRCPAAPRATTSTRPSAHEEPVGASA